MNKKGDYTFGLITASFLVLIVLAFLVYYFYMRPQPAVTYTNSSSYYIIRTFQNYAITYPNPTLTPGEIYTDNYTLICDRYYTDLLIDDSQSFKDGVFERYNMTNPEKKQYEIDHWIPLALGGSHNISNVWPEPVTFPGYKERDTVERYLRDQVCNHKITLTEAREKIVGDWYSIYTTILNE
jgi:hypothetical protein